MPRGTLKHIETVHDLKKHFKNAPGHPKAHTNCTRPYRNILKVPRGTPKHIETVQDLKKHFKNAPGHLKAHRNCTRPKETFKKCPGALKST